MQKADHEITLFEACLDAGLRIRYVPVRGKTFSEAYKNAVKLCNPGEVVRGVTIAQD